MTERLQLPAPPPQADRAKILQKALGKTGWVPAGERIRPLSIVRTGLHGLNNATTIDGIPVGLITCLFGPSGSGKSFVGLEIARSFIEAGGMAAYIDSEFRLRDSEHVANVMRFHQTDENGDTAFDSDGKALVLPRDEWPPEFVCQDPDRKLDLDTAAADAGKFCTASKHMTQAHDWYPGGVLIIDSLDSCIPGRFLAESLKDSDKVLNTDAITKGHQGMVTAGRIADWLKHLAAQAYHGNVAVIVICQERDKMVQIGPRQVPVPYPRGGKAIWFCSSLVFRVTGVQRRYYTKADQKGTPIGTVHTLEFRKSSVSDISITEGKHLSTKFYRSNGTAGMPAGVDEWMDMVENGILAGILVQKGSSVLFGEDRIGRSKADAAMNLYKDSALYAAVREAFYSEALASTRKEMLRTAIDGEPADDEPAPVTRGFMAKEFPLA